MKRLSAALILGFLGLSFCFAQIQTGNASYNTSKQGLTISHSSLSFNTRVRVTNLRNNRWVETSVDGRIPIDSSRVADISRDAGDALGMDKTGMTLVELAVLPFHPDESQSGATGSASPEPGQTPAAAQTPETAPPVPQQQAAGTPPAAAQTPETAPPVPQQQAAGTPPAAGAAQVLPVQTRTDVQYLPVPAAGYCCGGPLLLVILLLLILIIAILVVILVRLRRFFPWFWYYPLWLRRRRAKRFKRRRRLPV
jgi:hypothetical protein